MRSQPVVEEQLLELTDGEEEPGHDTSVGHPVTPWRPQLALAHDQAATGNMSDIGGEAELDPTSAGSLGGGGAIGEPCSGAAQGDPGEPLGRAERHRMDDPEWDPFDDLE